MKTQKRKQDHLHACINEDVQFKTSNGFEKYELAHKALPGIDLEDIDMSTRFLGKTFSVPIFIEAMTGGTEEAARINKNLAKAAQELGIGMGTGSQRAMIENPNLFSTFFVRDVAPDIFLAGNIGVGQMHETFHGQIISAVEKIKADAMIIHLNPAQEMAQFDGHDKWADALNEISKLCRELKIPVIVKEVGSGISGDVAKTLELSGVQAVDVAGAGGTSWIKVDSILTGKPLENFFEWGIPTARCVYECSKKVRIPIIASGGIRNGVEVAKSLALGATLAGMALPLLKPATKSSDAVKSVLEKVIMELKTAMFLTGSKNLSELKGKAVKA